MNNGNRGLKVTVKWLCAAIFFTLHSSLFTSCSEWDDHYDATTAADGAGASLWEQLKEDDRLSDFCQVLEQTKVFRMHRKTGVSYADLLRGGQSFTVVAPVNGSFNCDSLLSLVQTHQGDSMVEKSFVFNHISRMPTSVKGDYQTLRMLNGKNIIMQGNTIQDVPVVTSNLHASNGIIHVVSHALPYGFNLYEALCDDPELNLIGTNLRQYEWDEFDPDASVSNGVIDGVPVYVDSVVYERNRMLESIGLIASEDSAYWVVVPTNAGWERAWENVSSYYVYDKSYQRRDSLQRYWTNRALFDDAVFNITDQRGVTRETMFDGQWSMVDSLMSVPWLYWRKTYVSGKPKYHLFRKPFDEGGILSGARQLQCSNGMIFKTDEWPFKPEETFFKELWTEGESTWLIIEEKDCRYTGLRQVADSISDNGLLQVLPIKNTSNWELTFRMNNVLSGDYDVCAIILPQTAINPDATALKPCKFKAAVNYVDLEGKDQVYDCENQQFTTDPERVDTVVLAESFHFPATNYNQSTNKISVALKCNILARETSKYSREMLLDCIYLRPHKKSEQ